MGGWLRKAGNKAQTQPSWSWSLAELGKRFIHFKETVGTSYDLVVSWHSGSLMRLVDRYSFNFFPFFSFPFPLVAVAVSGK